MTERIISMPSYYANSHWIASQGACCLLQVPTENLAMRLAGKDFTDDEGRDLAKTTIQHYKQEVESPGIAFDL